MFDTPGIVFSLFYLIVHTLTMSFLPGLPYGLFKNSFLEMIFTFFGLF
jgi:hypothetical protein